MRSPDTSGNEQSLANSVNYRSVNNRVEFGVKWKNTAVNTAMETKPEVKFTSDRRIARYQLLKQPTLVYSFD